MRHARAQGQSSLLQSRLRCRLPFLQDASLRLGHGPSKLYCVMEGFWMPQHADTDVHWQIRTSAVPIQTRTRTSNTSRTEQNFSNTARNAERMGQEPNYDLDSMNGPCLWIKVFGRNLRSAGPMQQLLLRVNLRGRLDCLLSCSDHFKRMDKPLTREWSRSPL